MRIEVITAVKIWIAVFWDLTYSLTDRTTCSPESSNFSKELGKCLLKQVCIIDRDIN
jgi:hypothetical protein